MFFELIILGITVKIKRMTEIYCNKVSFIVSKDIDNCIDSIFEQTDEQKKLNYSNIVILNIIDLGKYTKSRFDKLLISVNK